MGESQLPLPSEILPTHAMSRAELRIAKLAPQIFNKTSDMSGNALSDGVHPHFK